VSRMGNERVLLIGPLPPPLGGDTVSTGYVLESGYWGEAGIDVISLDTSPRRGVRLPDESLSIGDIARALKIVSKSLLKMPGVGAVLLWANSRFICTVGLFLILEALILRKPVIVKIFGAYMAERIRGLPGPWRAVVLSVLGRTDCIMPQTERMAAELVDDIGIPGALVVCFPNFIVERDTKPREPGATVSGRCVFVGQVKREKGVFDIIDAIGGDDRFGCDFYGEIAVGDREEFLGAISDHDNLEYGGVVDPVEVRGIIAGYDVLLLPSYHAGEGQPAVVLEAFAARVPVVASEWKSIPDLVEDGVRGLLVPVRAPEAIREALSRLLAEPSLYTAIAENAFGYVGSLTEEAVVKGILIEKVREVIAS